MESDVTMPKRLSSLARRRRKGNAKAQHNFGLMYLQGRGAAKNESKGIDWLRKAAEQGVAVCQDSLGMALRDGSAEVRNLTEAAKWFQKAAEQDYLNAQVHLGGLYYFGGEGFEQDFAEAARWLGKADDHGQPWAQNTMGAMYESGQGVLPIVRPQPGYSSRRPSRAMPAHRLTSADST